MTYIIKKHLFESRRSVSNCPTTALQKEVTKEWRNVSILTANVLFTYYYYGNKLEKNEMGQTMCLFTSLIDLTMDAV